MSTKDPRLEQIRRFDIELVRSANSIKTVFNLSPDITVRDIIYNNTKLLDYAIARNLSDLEIVLREIVQMTQEKEQLLEELKQDLEIQDGQYLVRGKKNGDRFTVKIEYSVGWGSQEVYPEGQDWPAWFLDKFLTQYDIVEPLQEERAHE